MVQELREYIYACNREYGLNIHVSEATSEQTARLSDFLGPFMYSPTHMRVEAKCESNLHLSAIIEEEKLDASGFAMANPNPDAVYEDLYKYSYRDSPQFDEEEVNWVVQFVSELLSPACPTVTKPRCFDEAVADVDRSASTGFPENQAYATKGAWLDDGNIDQEAMVHRAAMSGVVTGNCSFKEEVRPLEKLEAEKARSFVAGNICENILWLMYCGEFFKKLAAGWRVNPIVYGLAELHRGWHFLVARCREWLGYKTDMKQCDGSLDYELQKIVGEVFKRFVTDEAPADGWPKAHEMIDRLIRMNNLMWIRLFNGVFFLKKQGNASGCGATIQINSIGQLITVLLWLRSRGLTKEQIVKYFEIQCHGDDGRYHAEGFWVKHLDFNDYNSYWKRRGKLYRMEAENEEPKRAHENSWLSRLTRVFEYTYVPYPADPAKLVASAVLKNRVPEGLEPRAYVMSRFWQLLNQLLFVPEEHPLRFDVMEKIGERFKQEEEDADGTLKNSLQWNTAQKHRKNKYVAMLAHTISEKVPKIPLVKQMRTEVPLDLPQSQWDEARAWTTRLREADESQSMIVEHRGFANPMWVERRVERIMQSLDGREARLIFWIFVATFLCLTTMCNELMESALVQSTTIAGFTSIAGVCAIAAHVPMAMWVVKYSLVTITQVSVNYPIGVQENYWVGYVAEYSWLESQGSGLNYQPSENITMAKPGKKVAKAVAKVVKKVVKSAKKQKQGKKKSKKSKVSVNVATGRGSFFTDMANKIKTNFGPGIKQGIHLLADRGASWLSNLIGAGDYKSSHRQVRANSLYNNVAEPPPSIMAGGDHQPYRRREKVADVWSSSAFQHQEIVFQPGLVQSFPWMSIGAKAFQRYNLRGAIVEFLHAVEPYGGGNVNGRVVLSARYDLSANAPLSINEAENSFFAEPGTPCENILMAIECAPETRPVNVLNIRTGELPSTANAQFFDHCIIDVCNQGQTDGTTQIGEIWISYDVMMEMPISESITGADFGGMQVYSDGGVTITNSAPFGPAATYSGSVHTTGMYASTLGAASLTVGLGSAPVGSQWHVDINSAAAAAYVTAVMGAPAGLSNCAVVNVYKNAAGTSISNFRIANTTDADTSFVVEVTGKDASFQVAGPTYSAPTTGCISVIVSPYDSNLSQVWMRKHHPSLYAAEEALNQRVRLIAAQMVDEQKLRDASEEKKTQCLRRRIVDPPGGAPHLPELYHEERKEESESEGEVDDNSGPLCVIRYADEPGTAHVCSSWEIAYKRATASGKPYSLCSLERDPAADKALGDACIDDMHDEVISLKTDESQPSPVKSKKKL